MTDTVGTAKLEISAVVQRHVQRDAAIGAAGIADGHPFFNLAGLGFEAEIAARYKKDAGLYQARERRAVTTFVVPTEDAAKALAARIDANGPLAVRVSKQIVKESRGWAMDERYAKQGQLIAPVFVSHDAREGAAAFAEKRKPQWKGR